VLENDTKTIEELNLLPLNQEAEKMLREVEVAPDPSRLFCIQLAWWAIGNSLAEVDESVVETVNAMQTWRPARLMNFLTSQGSGLAVLEIKVAGETPQELACKVLEIIENRMMIHFPWYFDVE
jgi:hypothetical protein